MTATHLTVRFVKHSLCGLLKPCGFHSQSPPPVVVTRLRAPSDYSEEPSRHPALKINAKASYLFYFTSILYAHN
ncbi:putative sulfite oxidase [Helianthus annuus]|uniref:Sulfite oxidase n=1 Tax=Helianthus annuus TaxID=4232 RepID=A0A9K3IN62_HELAN|nr:putative sulfite oxidase [Helianthus annuus]KAJ0905689.1 putative sulfite oxidase [Helianthus annuus]